MARIKLEFPAKVHFQTEMQVRVSDVNYSGHLGNDSLLSLVHECRVRFLAEFGCNELDTFGAGVIMNDAALVYKAEAFMGEVLTFELAIDDVSRVACDVYYRVRRKSDGKEIALAKTGIVFFDFASRKVMSTPAPFAAKFAV